MKTRHIFTTLWARAATTLMLALFTTAQGAWAEQFISDVTLNDGLGKIIVLADNAANDLAPYDGKKLSVTLKGRTIYKDGTWNTLCLPFNLDKLDGTPLEGATLMTLYDSSFAYGTLTLNFKQAKNIEAGKPYLVKWDKTNVHIDEQALKIDDPTFYDVIISKELSDVKTKFATFKGIYSPLVIAKSGDKAKLYLDASNKLCYPEISFNINTCRAYLQLPMKLVNANMGDVNGDGLISVADVMAMVNHILGGNSDNFYKENADINYDGQISIADVMELVNWMINGSQTKIKVVANTGDETITYGSGGSGPAK